MTNSVLCIVFVVMLYIIAQLIFNIIIKLPNFSRELNAETDRIFSERTKLIESGKYVEIDSVPYINISASFKNFKNFSWRRKNFSNWFVYD